MEPPEICEPPRITVYPSHESPQFTLAISEVIPVPSTVPSNACLLIDSVTKGIGIHCLQQLTSTAQGQIELFLKNFLYANEK